MAPDYWKYVRDNINYLESTVIRNFNGAPVPFIKGDVTEFGWDSKHSGINILVSQVHCLYLVLTTILNFL